MHLCMTRRATLLLLIINAIALALFLFIASDYWIEPELAGVPGANIGISFGWMLLAAPILLCFVAIDILCTVTAIVRADRPHRLKFACLGAALLACWVAAFLLDNAHHGM